MIIIEGPDGTGKSNLVRRLAKDTGLPVHPRAADSVKGPVPDLWRWVCEDVGSWDVQPLSIYDRHPMISEYIYGPAVRGRLPEGFVHPTSRGILRKMAIQSLVIFCMQPLEVVKDNVLNEDIPQMNGVFENLDAIWWSYKAARSNWQGWAIDYDFNAQTGKGSYDSVLHSVQLHMADTAGRGRP